MLFLFFLSPTNCSSSRTHQYRVVVVLRTYFQHRRRRTRWFANYYLLTACLATAYDIIIIILLAPSLSLSLGSRLSARGRRVWSAQEDDAIRKLVQKHGTSGWTLIADNLALEFESTHHGRSGKQCWERWHNHLGNNEVPNECGDERLQFMVLE